jgi:penicillin-binding protein A
MNRRLGIVGVFLAALFVVAFAQAVNVQFVRSASLNANPLNPRGLTAGEWLPRGDIVAADGSVLARSVASHGGAYPYKRVYPDGPLTAGVVGFASQDYGTWGLESEYNSFLAAHPQPAQSLGQLLAPSSAADAVLLTLQPALQRVAQTALAGRDGAVVALDPRTGAILALYANPTYDPTPMTSPSPAVEAAYWKQITTANAHGFPPLGLLATQQSFPPGSTFKVITTASAVVNRPDLLTKVYPVQVATKLPQSNLLLYNSGKTACGGTVAVMLPESCDPGYALLGLDLGGDNLAATANSFGYNQVPPIDLPTYLGSGVVASSFPAASSFPTDQPGLAYSAIGQKDVRATALQNALVAAGIANGGTVMTPHLMSQVQGPDGSVVKRYHPSVWLQPLTPLQANQLVPLMQNVVRRGTASGVGFPAWADVAAKTGTAQTGNSANNTDDWMIAFAPATHPVIAVAVVVPFQATSYTGALIAGPIVKCVIEGALNLSRGRPASGVPGTCPA